MKSEPGILPDLVIYIFAAILYLVVEIIFGAIFEGLCDYICKQWAAQWRFLRIVVYAGLGASCGALSLLVWTNHIVPIVWIRALAVVAVPPLLGLAMKKLGEWRHRKGDDPYGLESFWPAWGFATLFGYIRFSFAS